MRTYFFPKFIWTPKGKADSKTLLIILKYDSVKDLILLRMFVCPATLSVGGSGCRRWVDGCLYVNMTSLKVIAVDFNRVAKQIQKMAQDNAYLLKHSCLVDFLPRNVTHLEDTQSKGFKGRLLNKVRVVDVQTGEHCLRQGVTFQPCDLEIHKYTQNSSGYKASSGPTLFLLDDSGTDKLCKLNDARYGRFQFFLSHVCQLEKMQVTLHIQLCSSLRQCRV